MVACATEANQSQATQAGICPDTIGLGFAWLVCVCWFVFLVAGSQKEMHLIAFVLFFGRDKLSCFVQTGNDMFSEFPSSQVLLASYSSVFLSRAMALEVAGADSRAAWEEAQGFSGRH